MTRQCAIPSQRQILSAGESLILSGVGSVTQAIYIAKLHGIVLSNFDSRNYLRVA